MIMRRIKDNDKNLLIEINENIHLRNLPRSGERKQTMQ